MKKWHNIEQLQQHHFDSIASEYAKHYGDVWSQAYRYRFINDPMLGDVPLHKHKVMDALCGSGETTGYLLERGAFVTGVDISQDEMRYFGERWPNCTAKCASIFSTYMESDSYDCIVVVGGLHHLHPNLFKAIDEIYRMLKPGGYFCFMEPHKGSLPDVARRFWYKCDHLVAKNEAAIDLELLKREFASKFKFIKEHYKGNIAYLLVLNSMIFRIPFRLKALYSPLLIRLESIIEKTQGKLLSCFVICQWQKLSPR